MLLHPKKISGGFHIFQKISHQEIHICQKCVKKKTNFPCMSRKTVFGQKFDFSHWNLKNIISKNGLRLASLEAQGG